MFDNARQCSKNQGTADRSYAPAKIAVVPVAENTETDHGQQTAQEGPSGRKPRLKHPADRSAHYADAQPNTNERMLANKFAGRENHALRRRVHGRVGRLENNVKALEVDPHRM